MGGDKLYRAMQQQTAGGLVESETALGHAVDALEFDLGDTANIPRLFDTCEQRFGPVDIPRQQPHLLCVETFDPARVSAEGSGIFFISQSEIDQHFAVNTRSFALMMAEYTRRFLDRGAREGRIINISTDAPTRTKATSAMPPASTPSNPTAVRQPSSWANTASPSTSSPPAPSKPVISSLRW